MEDAAILPPLRQFSSKLTLKKKIMPSKKEIIFSKFKHFQVVLLRPSR